MKNPLSYQSTEYDCGPTTVLNAINYLFPREEIYPDVVKSIMQYSLDCYSDKGEAYKNGTTGMAMMFLTNWLNHFGKVKSWPIHCDMVNGSEVYIGANSRIAECLQQGGVAVVRVMYGNWHYMLLTGMDGENVYAFDPYYRQNAFKNKRIQMITNAPKQKNRKIAFEILNSEEKEYYSLGKKEQRECVLIYNSRTRQTMKNIEYFI